MRYVKRFDVDDPRASWAERRDVVLTVLGGFAVLWVISMLIGHFSHTLLLFTLAALFAYILFPVVTRFERVLPRPAAILLAYLLVLCGLGLVGYFIVDTATTQIVSVSHTVRVLLTPTGDGASSPLVQSLERVGISQAQIDSAGQQLSAQTERLTSSLLPLLRGTFNSLLDVVVVAILSVYLLIDGARLIRGLRNGTPLSQRSRVYFLLDTLDRIVGGYVRGQLLLSTIIGVLVGVGMFLFHVPYAVLLGLLAFIFAFIPILGTFASGVACVLLAFTQGWVIAVCVLGYFVLMHVVEGDVLGPRIVGKALGLHPILSILAVITGSELFGIKGALFASPLTGFVLALVAAGWAAWKASHPQEFTNAGDTGDTGTAVATVETIEKAEARG